MGGWMDGWMDVSARVFASVLSNCERISNKRTIVWLVSNSENTSLTHTHPSTLSIHPNERTNQPTDGRINITIQRKASTAQILRISCANNKRLQSTLRNSFDVLTKNWLLSSPFHFCSFALARSFQTHMHTHLDMYIILGKITSTGMVDLNFSIVVWLLPILLHDEWKYHNNKNSAKVSGVKLVSLARPLSLSISLSVNVSHFRWCLCWTGPNGWQTGGGKAIE